jgi:L-fucose mutarotase/ribose pyranase (RbsD/FucU family)
MKLPRTLATSLLAIALLTAVGCASHQPGPEQEWTWQDDVRERLPAMGHRNWIVIADAAYPLQTAPGIETIYIGGDQIEALQSVIEVLEESRHVKPTFHVDAELVSVAEDDAPGITDYRNALGRLLTIQPTVVTEHEKIIAKLDEAGRTFKVLILKTDLTLPYTSVFINLECGYWDAESEARLRDKMATDKNR